MRARRSPLSGRSRVGAVVATTLAVAAVATLVAWQPWARPSAPLQDAASGVEVYPMPARIDLPEGASILVFGDSWTYGSAATVVSDGYAYVLGRDHGWTTVVNGIRGSGYLREGIDGPDFGTRMKDLDPTLDPDLVIVQGSINDRAQGADGYREAVHAAWDTLVATYPDAQVVILGPAPHVLPVGRGTARIDRDLRSLAAERGWWYISPIDEQWITPDNYAAVIDTGIGRNHPSTAGHAYLAERLADDLLRLSAPPTDDTAATDDPASE